MTITVVRGLLGKPVEQVTTLSPKTNPQDIRDTTAHNAAVTVSVQHDAVVTSLRTTKSQERERVETFTKAKEVTDEVKEQIRDNPDEAVDAHRGLNSSDSREAFV